MAFRPDIRAPQTGETRRGRGFSLQELKEAGISLQDARWMAIPIDTRRKTRHTENISTLQDFVKRIKKLGKPAKVAKPKIKAEKPKAAKPKAKPIETDLAELKGVTKKQAEALAEAGIASIQSLSTTSPRRLARTTDLKRDRAEKLIESAKRHQREKTKATREEKSKEPKITELKHLPDISRDDIKQLNELGVATLEDLKNENPRDLALLTGIPEKQIKEWRKIIRSLDEE
ncbi:MAG: ribosomal protein L13e [Candidatus Thorarchaeota archaeon]